MSLNAMSGLSADNINSLGSALTGPHAPSVAQGPSAISTAAYPTQASSPAKPQQPFLLVPTEPLSPTVLAELIGRQISLTGPTPELAR
jgi:hypothetical protein